MKILNILIAPAVLGISLAANIANAEQPPQGAWKKNLTPEQQQAVQQQWNSMTPEQQQAMKQRMESQRQKFESMTPEQQAADAKKERMKELAKKPAGELTPEEQAEISDYVLDRFRGKKDPGAAVAQSYFYAEKALTKQGQAFAAAKPVVASDIEGNRELIGQDERGILFTTADVNSLVASIKMLSRSEIYNRKAIAARQFVLDNGLTWSGCARKYLALVEEICAEQSCVD